MAAEVLLMYRMLIEPLYYLFVLGKVLLLLCSTHLIAVASLCASSGCLCCLAQTGSTLKAPRQGLRG